MYGVVLMAALSSGSTAPEQNFYYGAHRHSYIYGCYGGYGAYGCYGGWGGFYTGCHGGYVFNPGGYIYAGPGGGYYGFGAMGCFGCYGGGYNGGVGYTTGWNCHGCYGGHSGYATPAMHYHPGSPSPGYMPGANGTKPPPEKVPPPKEEKKDDEKKGDGKKDEGKNGKDEAAWMSNRGKLVVELPADARLFIDNQPTTSTSARRVFATPVLQPGQVYYYDVRAEVVRDGVTRSAAQRVLIRAGAEAVASFTSLDPGAATTATAAVR